MGISDEELLNLDLYSLLEIEKNATDQEIKEMRVKLEREFHCDRKHKEVMF
jgi:DnaJ-class molecular chaperone